MIITAGGLKGSKRGVRDGVTIFGIYKGDNEKYTKTIDYRLNLENPAEFNFSIVFFIYFNKESAKYYIRGYKSKNKQDEYVIPSVIVQVINAYVRKNFILLYI